MVEWVQPPIPKCLLDSMGVTVALVALETNRQPQRGKWFRLLEPEVMAGVCNGKLIPALNFRRNKFFHCGLDTINCCFQLFVTVSWALMFCCFFFGFFFPFLEEEKLLILVRHFLGTSLVIWTARILFS